MSALCSAQLAHYECFGNMLSSLDWLHPLVACGKRHDSIVVASTAPLSPARDGRCPMDGRCGARHTHGSLCRLDHTSTRCSCKCAAVHLPDTTAEVGLSYCTARKRVLIRTRSRCEPSELDDSCTRHVRTAPNFTCPDGLPSALSLSHTAANQNDPSI